MRAIRRHPWRVVSVLAVVSAMLGSLLVFQAVAAPSVPTKTIGAPVDRVEGVDSTSTTSTTSTTYVNMSGMSRSFTLAGTNNKKVVVMFQGVMEVFDSAVFASIRLLIDGNVQSGPQPVLVDQFDFQTAGFNFITDSLAPGQHTAVIQWKSGSGAEIFAADRSLIVLLDG